MRCPLAVGLLMVTVPSLHSTWTELSLCVVRIRNFDVPSHAVCSTACNPARPGSTNSPSLCPHPVIALHFAFLCRHEIPPGMARLAIRKVLLVTMLMTVAVCGRGANGPPRSLLVASTLTSQVTPFRVCSVELRGRDPARPSRDVLLQTPLSQHRRWGREGGGGGGTGWVTFQPGAPMSHP